jgi:hypothetical protein
LVDVIRPPGTEVQRLKTELAPEYDNDPANRYRVEAGLVTREEITRSPDLADGFNLAATGCGRSRRQADRRFGRPCGPTIRTTTSTPAESASAGTRPPPGPQPRLAGAATTAR